MLNSHPDLAIPRESHFLIEAFSRRNLELEPRHALLEILTRSTWFSAWNFDLERVREALNRPPPQDIGEAVRRLYRAYAAAQGKSRYGDKTPIYVMHMPTLLHRLPEARFVHLIRDGRDVALSFLEADFGPQTIEEAALHWRQRIRRGREVGRHLTENQYLEVTYEDLISNPESCLRTICAFIDLPFHPSMLDYQNRLKDFAGTNALPSHHRNLARNPGVTRRWQQEMEERGAVRFELLAGRELTRAGYPVSGRSPMWADRCQAGMAWLRWQGYRLGKKLGLSRAT